MVQCIGCASHFLTEPPARSSFHYTLRELGRRKWRSYLCWGMRLGQSFPSLITHHRCLARLQERFHIGIDNGWRTILLSKYSSSCRNPDILPYLLILDTSALKVEKLCDTQDTKLSFLDFAFTSCNPVLSSGSCSYRRKVLKSMVRMEELTTSYVKLRSQKTVQRSPPAVFHGGCLLFAPDWITKGQTDKWAKRRTQHVCGE